MNPATLTYLEYYHILDIVHSQFSMTCHGYVCLFIKLVKRGKNLVCRIVDLVAFLA